MHSRAWIIGACLILSTVANTVLFGIAWSQVGTVISHQKISDLAGNFSEPLRNLDEFGGAAVSLGDLDGAGPSVVAVAVGAAGDSAYRGAVYVLFLDATGKTLSYRKINSTQGNFTALLHSADQFGSAVANLGDLDGPGPSVVALAVGATGDDDGGLSHGAVYVLFLASTGNVLSFQKISDTQGNFLAPLLLGDEFGGACASLGDLDGPGPGVAALAVGAIGDEDGGPDRGATYVLFLASTGNVLSYQKISDTQGNFAEPLENVDEFGGSLAGLGDLDGSGPSVAALAVGAVGDDDGGTGRGAIYVLFLSSTGNVLSYKKISNTQGNFTALLDDSDEFGGSIARLGDLDASGPSVMALAVGTAGDDDGGTDRGATYVVFLNSAGSVLSYQKISATQGNFHGTLSDEGDFGGSVAALGDIDGVGVAVQALVVGAALDDDGGTDRGALYVLFLAGAVPTGVEQQSPGFLMSSLGHARPNPFRPGTTMPFRIGQPSSVRIDILDVKGRLVRELFAGHADAGEHQAVWNGLDDKGHHAAPGSYFYRMSVDGKTLTTSAKVVLLK